MISTGGFALISFHPLDSGETAVGILACDSVRPLGVVEPDGVALAVELEVSALELDLSVTALSVAELDLPVAELSVLDLEFSEAELELSVFVLDLSVVGLSDFELD